MRKLQSLILEASSASPGLKRTMLTLADTLDVKKSIDENETIEELRAFVLELMEDNQRLKLKILNGEYTEKDVHKFVESLRYKVYSDSESINELIALYNEHTLRSMKPVYRLAACKALTELQESVNRKLAIPSIWKTLIDNEGIFEDEVC